MFQTLVRCNLPPISSRVLGRSTNYGRSFDGTLSQSWRLPARKTHKILLHLLSQLPERKSSRRNGGGGISKVARPTLHLSLMFPQNEVRKGWEMGNCRAALADDAPFAVAIGASILSTLVLPVSTDQKDKEDSLFGPDDVRSGAMQIISFIPLFNWLVWVFAWLDTRQQRYLVFAIVYLLPYLKVGLSLSSEDSWLPISSVLACIVHVQLDISVNAEGRESPLGDISKLLLEKRQIKDLRGRADGILDRLKELAEKTDVRPIEKTTQEADQQEGSEEEWKAIQKEVKDEEFEEWDKKFSKSKAMKEVAKEIDS